VRERVDREPGLQVLFLESYCDDPAIIATNVALKVQSGDPDYKDMTKAEAEADFRKRIAAYESVYQTISEPEISFCRILNVGRQVTINKIEGYLQSRIAFYLMNLHLKPRNIYLSRVSWLPCPWLRELANLVARRIDVQCRWSNWWRFRSVTAGMEIRSSLASSY
jgi:6-phosphofructo-2-kinase/fructose-2,6-biphosphatase 2